MFTVPFTQPPSAMVTRSLNAPTRLETWHRRLVHIGESTVWEMMSKQIVNGLSVTDTAVNGRCEDYIIGKQAQRPFDTVHEPESTPYKRVAFNIWGPARVQMTGGKMLMLVATNQAGG